MILINLLPPELRKRATTYNPLIAAMCGGLAACLLLAVFCAYIQFKKIPQAQSLLADKQEELERVKADAQKVADLQAKIDEIKVTVDKLHELLNRKVYWAHTLDDFCTLLSSNFPGFTLRCVDLSITPGAAARGQTEQVFSFRGRYQILGEDAQRTGDYIDAMFRGIGGSVFWKQHGFTGKPDDSFVGDRPVVADDIKRVIDTLSLEFHRVATKKKAGG